MQSDRNARSRKGEGAKGCKEMREKAREEMREGAEGTEECVLACTQPLGGPYKRVNSILLAFNILRLRRSALDYIRPRIHVCVLNSLNSYSREHPRHRFIDSLPNVRS